MNARTHGATLTDRSFLRGGRLRTFAALFVSKTRLPHPGVRK